MIFTQQQLEDEFTVEWAAFPPESGIVVLIRAFDEATGTVAHLTGSLVTSESLDPGVPGSIGAFLQGRADEWDVERAWFVLAKYAQQFDGGTTVYYYFLDPFYSVGAALPLLPPTDAQPHVLAWVRRIGPWIISAPGATYSFDSRVGKSLAMPYGVYGRMPERTVEDMIRSLKKHVAEVLDEVGGRWLEGYDEDGEEARSDVWEVRLWDEPGAFKFPFARVSLVGPDTATGPAFHETIRQPVTIHLYPFGQLDSERAWLEAMRLATTIKDALQWGAARGKPYSVPLWDHHDLDLYEDSEYRHPSDYFRVDGLSTERMIDPEDDRYSSAIVNFTAQWRRAPNMIPGQVVESVRIMAYPQ